MCSETLVLLYNSGFRPPECGHARSWSYKPKLLRCIANALHDFKLSAENLTILYTSKACRQKVDQVENTATPTAYQ